GAVAANPDVDDLQGELAAEHGREGMLVLEAVAESDRFARYDQRGAGRVRRGAIGGRATSPRVDRIPELRGADQGRLGRKQGPAISRVLASDLVLQSLRAHGVSGPIKMPQHPLRGAKREQNSQADARRASTGRPPPE